MINLNPNSNESPLVSDTDHPIFNIIKQNDIDSLNRLLSANGNEVHSTDENVRYFFKSELLLRSTLHFFYQVHI